jgi:hypothetical protein
MFVAGMWSWIVPTPLWSSRVLNVVLGTLSVPALFGVATSTWDPRIGLLAAVALALFPLHAELSASGLAEPAFLFELSLGWWLLLRAARSSTAGWRIATMVAGGLSVALAEMTRYEGWIFAAVLLAWWLVRVRRWADGVLLAILLLGFPVAWTIGNARCGDALMGFHASLQEPAAGAGFTLLPASWYLTKLTATELGPGLLALALFGVGLETQALIRRRSTMERLLALAMVAVAWLFLERFAMSRGASAWNRYGLVPFVLLLPFAFVPLGFVRKGRTTAIVATVVVMTSFAYPLFIGVRVNRWVRSDPPLAARDLAVWLSADTERSHMLIVSTPVGWELTFLPLYEPSAAQRLCTLSSWTPAPDLASLITKLQGGGPFVFVTRPGDEQDLARIERMAGVSLVTTPPVFETGGLQVHLLQLAASRQR